MNFASLFNNFYNNLSSDGLFFFWVVVFLFFFLIFLAVVLAVKNRRLAKCLKEELKEKKEESVVKVEHEEALPINDNISVNLKEDVIEDHNEESKEVTVAKEEVNNKKEVDNTISDSVAVKRNTNINDGQRENGLYQKNILREMNARMQTSPIHIDHFDSVDNSLENKFDERALLEEETLSPLEMMEDNYEVNDNMKLASEIVDRMEKEVKPSNIELTDYEKKQEEEAIISYDELLKVKDKIYNITEDEETDEFIDELKNFRLDLQ